MENVALSMQPDLPMPTTSELVPEAQALTLRTLIVPYKGGQAVLPNTMVVEVLPYAPSLGIENAPPWVIGSMLWKALPLPLISLEFMAADGPLPEAGTHSRIIVVQAVNNHPKLRYYGLVGSEAPRIIDLEREQIAKEVFLMSSPANVASQVLIQGHSGIVPDIDAIETALSEVLTAARSL